MSCVTATRYEGIDGKLCTVAPLLRQWSVTDQQLSCQLASHSGTELGSVPMRVSHWFTNKPLHPAQTWVECDGHPTPSVTSIGDERTDLRGGENAKGTTPPGRADLAASLAPDAPMGTVILQDALMSHQHKCHHQLGFYKP